MKLGVLKSNGEKFAVKIMEKEEHNPRKKEIIDIEIEILKRVDHDHVRNPFFSSLFFFFLLLNKMIKTGCEIGRPL